MIGIIGAMEEEISKLKEIMENKEIKDIIKNAMNELVKCYKVSKNI